VIYEVWLLASLVIAFGVTKFVANAFGVGWGMGAFFAVAIAAALVAGQMGQELGGSCSNYGPRAQAADYC
jgi:hypothetical protein